jgi:hypothetical protein
MLKPDVTDFEVCRTLIYHCIDFSLAKRNELFAEGKIDANDYIERRKKF